MRVNKLGALFAIAGIAFIVLALVMLVFAVQNSSEFEKYYVKLIILSFIGLALVLMVLLISMWRLFVQYRKGVVGSKLHLKMVGFFVLSTLIPTAILYFFAVKLLNSSIDNWFNIQVTEALQNSYELGQVAIDERKKRLIRETYFIANGLDKQLEKSLLNMREQSNAYELSLFNDKGEVLAFSHSDAVVLVPKLPSDTILSQVKTGGSYHEVEEIKNLGDIIRVIVKVPKTLESNSEKDTYLHAVFQMPQRINNLLANVNETSAGFKQIEFMQPQLRQSLVITLSMVLFVALAAAIWLAFYLARKLSTPVMELAQGTRQVADGVYKMLPSGGNDELGFLVNSFNKMIQKVDEAQLTQKHQRAFLDEILTNLSSGVIVIDENGILQRKNHAVEQIFNIDFGEFIDKNILQIFDDKGDLNNLFVYINSLANKAFDNKTWEIEEKVLINNVNKVINIRGRKLPAASNLKGTVIVFDDITERIVGQRNAAWSEVARRLAHEIKNPLTPIQLSAERIRNKCIGKNAGSDKVIERGTKTIVLQVEALKKMVEEFSEFAKVPELNLQDFDLTNLIKDVVELYKSNNDIIIKTRLNVQKIRADANRLRQLLHNIIKNTLEIEGKKPVTLAISSEYNTEQDINIRICDDGGGIPQEMLGTVFEPYITDKPKGTGLGLAIVKRIIEEHSGMIDANNNGDGVCFNITLPVKI